MIGREQANQSQTAQSVVIVNKNLIGFSLTTGINKHSWNFQRLQIPLALWAQIQIFLWKNNLCLIIQIELEIIWFTYTNHTISAT